MADSIRVSLKEPFPEGSYVDLRYMPGEMPIGILEDFESGRWKGILDGLAELIADGKLPKGADRAGLRRLNVNEARALADQIADAALALPKVS